MFLKKRNGFFFFAVVIGFAMNRLANIHLDMYIEGIPHPLEYWDFRHAVSGLGKKLEARRARWSGSVASVFGEDPVAYGIIRKCS